MTARGRMVTQMALPAMRWQNTVPTTAPTAKKNSMPAWRAHFSRWDLSALLRWCRFLGEADADLADVVGDEGRGHGDALGLAEGVILHGGEEVYDDLRYLHRRGIGDAPSISTAAISMNMSTVSQRTKKRCFIGLGSSSETNEPRI